MLRFEEGGEGPERHPGPWGGPAGKELWAAAADGGTRSWRYRGGEAELCMRTGSGFAAGCGRAGELSECDDEAFNLGRGTEERLGSGGSEVRVTATRGRKSGNGSPGRSQITCSSATTGASVRV